MHQKNFQKLKISLEGQLMGLKYFRALRAMNIALHLHDGERKDGTPEFQHQVEQCLFALSLSDVPDLEELCVVIFLHDTIEDKGLTIEDVASLPHYNFGIDTANRVYAMSKVYRGVKRDSVEVAERQSLCYIVAIAKGIDRIHNHGTMTAAFSLEKIRSYLTETEKHILPMLKRARKNFPQYSGVFYLIETVLHRDIHMLNKLIEKHVK